MVFSWQKISKYKLRIILLMVYFLSKTTFLRIILRITDSFSRVENMQSVLIFE